MKTKFYLFILTLLFISCARVQTLNLKEHKYSERPDHIVWIQVPGLSEEQLALIKLNNSEVGKLELEKMDCTGKSWAYNLYELRPSTNKSFIAQINGTKNIKNTCEDYSGQNAWGLLKELGYSVGILEVGANKNESLLAALDCKENTLINEKEISFYSMTEGKGKKTFHYQDSAEASKLRTQPGIYYDKSCSGNFCYSSLFNNTKTLWGQFHRERSRSAFVIRDFNLQKALVARDLSQIKEALVELNRLIAEFNEANREDLLVLVTSAESMPIEMPAQGKEWTDFVKNGKNVLYKKTSLMAPVFAQGAMSENFCGMYEESEILKRLLYKPEEKVFNIDYVLPF